MSIFCEQSNLLNKYNYFNSQETRSGNYYQLFWNSSFDFNGEMSRVMFLSVQAMSDINSFKPTTEQKELLYCLISGINNTDYSYLITYKVSENKLCYYQKYPDFSVSYSQGMGYINVVFNKDINDISFSNQYDYFLDITYET